MAEGGAHGVWPLLQVLLAADDEEGAHGGLAPPLGVIGS